MILKIVLTKQFLGHIKLRILDITKLFHKNQMIK